jgi:hypothetical protein
VLASTLSAGLCRQSSTGNIAGTQWIPGKRPVLGSPLEKGVLCTQHRTIEIIMVIVTGGII